MRLDPEALTTVVITTIKQTVGPIVADLAALTEQVAALAERTPAPGPPGPPGPPGERGPDGLGFDDLAVTHDGGRLVTLELRRGDLSKSFPLVFPIPQYRGAYTPGATYTPGDLVMHGGSAWHCDAVTVAPPLEGRDEWRLFTRRGRDGKRGSV